jgi:predicted dehydrogenase
VKVLIVGVGSIGLRHLRNLGELGVSDVRVCRSGHGRDVTLPIPVTQHTSLEAALEARPDAVIVANPTALHVPVSTRAAEAGCHLLIEKPLSHSLEGVERLAAVVRERGVLAMPAFNMRFHPTLRAAHDFLARGRIGRFLAMTAHVGQYLPDWHPHEDYRTGYSARRALGGGVLLDLCHELDIAIWLGGAVRKVTCQLGRISELEIETEDVADVLLKFVDGGFGHVRLDYLERPSLRQFRVTGSTGSLVVDALTAECHVFESTTGRWVKHVVEGFERNDMYLEELRHFIEAASGRVAPRVSLGDGLRVQAVLAAARASADTERSVDVPPLGSAA